MFWPWSFVGEVDTKELETLNPLHYNHVDVKVFGSPFLVVHDQLLCLAHIEGGVVVLAPHWQFSDDLPIGCLIIVGDQAYHLLSANVLMVLESRLATQSWVNREYTRRLSTPP